MHAALGAACMHGSLRVRVRVTAGYNVRTYVRIYNAYGTVRPIRARMRGTADTHVRMRNTVRMLLKCVFILL